jgi:glycosyltransferase involved in cell wall biosynthesis
MKIIFYIGSIDISGGTYVILQHARHMHEKGHEVTLAALYHFEECQLNWHPAIEILKLVHVSALPADHHFDLAIATWWKTALEICSINADRYIYFVQSIESRFYTAEEIPLRKLVDCTYDLPMVGITEAKWIQAHLRQHHSKDYHLVPNGIRKDIYKPSGAQVAPRLTSGIRVLIEGPLGVAFKNVTKSLHLARKSEADEIWLLTSTEAQSLPFIDRVFSRVPVDRVGEIYRSCDIVVKLSYVEGMFGPPLEMFHCGGTAIVYDVTGHDEYIQNESNSLVVKTDDESGVIAAINRLKSDPVLLARLKAGAAKTADTWPSWEDSSQRWMEAVEALLSASASCTRDDLIAATRQAWADYTPAETQRLADSKWSLRIRKYKNKILNTRFLGIGAAWRNLKYGWEIL